jgi:hypothetical protein
MLKNEPYKRSVQLTVFVRTTTGDLPDRPPGGVIDF